MAYDEYQAERITDLLDRMNIPYTQKKMMGGLCIMVDEKMLCGLLKNKETEENMLMARIGEASYEPALEKEGVSLMNFTGRAMKGYVFVNERAMDREDDLEYWIEKCLAFNPLAKASKKKKRKTP